MVTFDKDAALALIRAGHSLDQPFEDWWEAYWDSNDSPTNQRPIMTIEAVVKHIARAAHNAARRA